jgi:hypothetical protein
LGAFLKTAFYRVIFVLIVGIPAVELFSWTFFENGRVIQKVESDLLPSLPPFGKLPIGGRRGFLLHEATKVAKLAPLGAYRGQQ